MKQITKVALLDTSVASENKGDEIIVESTKRVIKDVFENAFITTVPTHERIFKRSYEIIESADASIVAGSNLLSSSMWSFRQWRLGIIDAFFVNDLTFCGVGWWRYQNDPSTYSKILLKRISSSKKIHAVRDSYTKKMLEKSGVENVKNTSCPTMWKLDKKGGHFEGISDSVVFTLTCYKKGYADDKNWVKTIQDIYEDVYFWPQQAGDFAYLRSLENVPLSEIEFLRPGLDSFDELLRSDTDYVGTRLHGGIRSLQHGNRTLILSIDNRAREMSKDTGLPTAPRDEPGTIRQILTGPQTIEVDVPTENIEFWKKSLREKVHS